MGGRILLVEDDSTTRRLLTYVLLDAGHLVTPAADGAAALQLLQQQPFDVVVTDIRMGEIDGIDVLNTARARSFPPEVILLTGHGSFETALAALRAGAFNYLLKPCGSDELIQCVNQALQRRAAEQRRIEAARVLAQEFGQLRDERAVAQAGGRADGVALDRLSSDGANHYLHVGALQIDTLKHAATFEGRQLHLTPTEFALLCCLAEAPGRVLSCTEIVRRTHGYSAQEAEAQVLLRAHVRNLRRKLPSTYLVTVRGVGYKLSEPSGPPGLDQQPIDGSPSVAGGPPL